MKNITREFACDRIALFAAEGCLKQRVWHIDGREIACILGSIDPSIENADTCPASVMPGWMAHLVVRLFDGARRDRWLNYAARFASALRAWRTDESVQAAFLIQTVEAAVNAARPKGDVPHYWPAVDAACGDVIAALRAGGVRAGAERQAAAVAARAARDAAAWGAATAAWYVATAALDVATAAWGAATAAWAVVWAADAADAAGDASNLYETLLEGLIAAMEAPV